MNLSISTRIAPLMLFILALSGCQSNPQTQRLTVVDAHITDPICNNKKECDDAWALARHWVLQHSSRKLQHYSNDYMETYGSPRNSPANAYRVEKLPAYNGTKIVLTTGCNNVFGCTIHPADAITDFNRTVNGGLSQMVSHKYKTLVEATAKDLSCDGRLIPLRKSNSQESYSVSCGDRGAIKIICSQDVCKKADNASVGEADKHKQDSQPKQIITYKYRTLAEATAKDRACNGQLIPLRQNNSQESYSVYCGDEQGAIKVTCSQDECKTNK